MDTLSTEEFRKLTEKNKEEKHVQQEIIQWLRLRGWRVPAELIGARNSISGVYLVCGTKRRKGDHQGTMQTPGIPDLWLCPIGWKFWIGIEIKRPVDGKVRPEQQMLSDAGLSYVVRSVEEVKIVLEKARNHTDFSKPVIRIGD